MRPSEITRIADRIARYLAMTGLQVERDTSSLSASAYIMVRNEQEDDSGVIKIRISDHRLPPTYARANGHPDFEVGPYPEANPNWAAAVEYACAQFGQPVPAPAKASLTRIRKAIEADDAARRALYMRAEARERAAHEREQAIVAAARASGSHPETIARIDELTARLSDPANTGYRRKKLKAKLAAAKARLAA